MNPAPARAARRVNSPSIRHSPMANRAQVSRKANCSIRVQVKGFRLGAKGPPAGRFSAKGLKSTTSAVAAAASFFGSAGLDLVSGFLLGGLLLGRLLPLRASCPRRPPLRPPARRFPSTWPWPLPARRMAPWADRTAFLPARLFALHGLRLLVGWRHRRRAGLRVRLLGSGRLLGLGLRRFLGFGVGCFLRRCLCRRFFVFLSANATASASDFRSFRTRSSRSAFKAFSRESKSAIQPLASLRRSCISSQRRCVWNIVRGSLLSPSS